MLPSSHRRKKTGPELNDNMTLGDIERYYKKTNAPANATAAAIDGRYDRDATGARDKSKIRKKISKQNGYKSYKEDSDDVGDDGDNYGYLNELESSYIESYISDTVSLSHIEEEEEYESKYDNGLSIKTHKMTNIKYPFADKPSEHLTHDLDNIYENLGEDTGLGNGEILVEYLVYYINKKAYKPFLEFMLYKSDDDDTFYFPNFSQDTSSYDILENADLLLDNLLGADVCTFKGRLIETDYMNDIKSAYINQRVILLY